MNQEWKSERERERVKDCGGGRMKSRSKGPQGITGLLGSEVHGKHKQSQNQNKLP